MAHDRRTGPTTRLPEPGEDAGGPGPHVPGVPAIPPLYRRLCDDAALFPPGSAPMADAVPAHHAHGRAWYADLVGPFVVAAARVAELADVVREFGATREIGAELDVVVIVPDGAAGVGPAVAAVRGAPGLALAGIEVATPDGGDGSDGSGGSDEGSVADVLAAFEAHVPDQVPATLEVPRGGGREAALDALAGTGRRAKFRTGGTVAAAFPDEDELARAIAGCHERDIAFKCTAGLHNALRHRDPVTGFEHHGFLNVLAATAAAVGGAGPDQVADVLRERSGTVVAAALRGLGEAAAAGTRRRFVSYGTCSVLEPLDDLIGLGLIQGP